MRSITLARASLFAAIVMVLLTAYQLLDNAVMLETSPVLLVLGSAVPGLSWGGFFFAIYRSPSSVKAAAWITLVLAVLLETVVTYIRFQQSVGYWTPFGNAVSLTGWLLRFGWVVFLVAFALAPDQPITRLIALVLALLSVPSALSTAYDAWNNWIGLLFEDIPGQAFWRVLITPSIRTVYWLSQIVFLWTVSRTPRTSDSIETLSAHLRP